MSKKVSTLKPTLTQRVTTQVLTLEAIENKDVIIPDVEIKKGDFGATATFTAIDTGGKSVKVRTYAWNIIQALDSAKTEDCFPVVTRVSLVNGKWMIVDPEHPEVFDNWDGKVTEEAG